MWKTRDIGNLDYIGESFALTAGPTETTHMAASNNLYGKLPNRNQEQVGTIEQQIGKLEEDIRKLKIDFDIYFNGAVKRPPLEARARLESQIKRMTDNRKLTFAQRYQLNGLLARYTSYREVWRRTLKARGDETL